jgi:hypothetical protein
MMVWLIAVAACLAWAVLLFGRGRISALLVFVPKTRAR